MDRVQPELLLSKLCEQTFGNYALTRIKKARGLNKKILNPVEKKRKSVLDFCFVVQGQGSVPVKEFLKSQGMDQENCGLSRIPHMHEMYGLFNQSAYSSYCKAYKEYWEWVGKRNELRYENTLANGKNYDAKNMMHTFRLLAMAEEIGKEGKVNVRRTDREFLLEIKKGNYEYDYLVNKAEAKLDEVKRIFKSSSLPDTPDMGAINQLLVDMRKEFYIR